MIVISPACVNNQTVLHSNSLGEVIKAIGSNDFESACLDLFERSLEAEHWALYRYRATRSVGCVATASRVYKAAAKENVDRFVAQCHRVDPSLSALKQNPEGPCVTKIDIGDIRDRQYRRCFEMTRVHERLSFFSRLDTDLYQLCIYRGVGRRPFSAAELAYFPTLAGLILLASLKHERFCHETVLPRHLDLDAIERCLGFLAVRLSKREREVCSRAAAGKTIEATALELDIQRTSVITYRQRAYEKLGISRQNELIALVNNLRQERPVSH